VLSDGAVAGAPRLPAYDAPLNATEPDFSHRALPSGAGTARHYAIHEPLGQLPRQRADGEESFFASLKTEHVHQARFRTRAEARAAVFDYIEIFYNRQRLHSVLGYRTPAEARASMEGITMLAAA
jgi:transposase InsO family protein